MLRALSTAATGMGAQELQIDVISNNLANVNTNGFKRSRAEFQDLLYVQINSSGGADPTTGTGQAPIEVGQGVRPVSTRREFGMGSLKETGNALDLAVEGEGFFKVRRPNGQVAYTRDGSFRTDATGQIVNADGLALDTPIVVPPNARRVIVSAEGDVAAVAADDVNPTSIGMIRLSTFANPAGLESIGHNLYLETAASGSPSEDNPGVDGRGHVAQGFLELSNVNVVEEMIALITAQRAYEMNSRVIQGVDEMLRNTANMR